MTAGVNGFRLWLHGGVMSSVVKMIILIIMLRQILLIQLPLIFHWFSYYDPHYIITSDSTDIDQDKFSFFTILPYIHRTREDSNSKLCPVQRVLSSEDPFSYHRHCPHWI